MGSGRGKGREFVWVDRNEGGLSSLLSAGLVMTLPETACMSYGPKGGVAADFSRTLTTTARLERTFHNPDMTN